MSVLRQRLAVSAVLVTALTVTVATGCASNAKPPAGATIVKGVYANGYVDSYMAGAPADASAIGGANAPATGNSAPSAADAHLSDGTVGETAFQHKGSAGPEVWIIDKYQRDANSVK